MIMAPNQKIFVFNQPEARKPRKSRFHLLIFLKIYLNMSFVCVNRTRELRFLADSVRKDDDLLEQENCHLLQLEIRST